VAVRLRGLCVRFSHRWDPTFERSEVGQSRAGFRDLYLKILPEVLPHQLRWTLQTASAPEVELGEVDFGLGPDDGFLLPNYCCGRGEGAVSFTVRVRDDLPDGTRLRCTSTTRFDRARVFNVEVNELIVCRSGSPDFPRDPFPPRNAEAGNVPPNAVLMWEADCRTDFFEIYLWKDGEPEPTEATATEIATNEFRPGPLEPDTLYHWRVVAGTDLIDPETEEGFPMTPGPLWSFRTGTREAATLPARPQRLTPNAACTIAGGRLSWSAPNDPSINLYAVFYAPVAHGSPTELLSLTLANQTSVALPDDILPGAYLWQVVAMNSAYASAERGTASEVAVFIVRGPSGVYFDRGDSNADGILDISDAIGVLDYLFVGLFTPPCLDAADADDTGVIDTTDAARLFDVVFLGGEPLPPPYLTCGLDFTFENCLGCTSYLPCQEDPLE
jgi:hypothetical protein